MAIEMRAAILFERFEIQIEFYFKAFMMDIPLNIYIQEIFVQFQSHLHFCYPDFVASIWQEREEIKIRKKKRVETE